MWPYWLMFMLPAVAALTGSTAQAPVRGRRRWSPGWVIAVVSLALLIGFRHEVGGDWGGYLRHFYDHPEALSDPGYRFLNWASAELDWDIYGVNLACGAFFAFCLAYFCRELPRPWLALAVAIPYLVIVVGMGYTRQAVALGFGMLGMAMLQQRKILWFVAWVLLGATFHKTAVLLLPIAALSKSKNRYWTVLWVGVIGVLAYQVLLGDSAEELYTVYVESGYQSEGALVRALMNSLPAAILLLWWKRFQLGTEGAFWRWLAAISVMLPGVLFVVDASTAVDRLALYMLPIQLVVFAHLPDVLAKRRVNSQQWVVVVLLYYFLVQFTWLNYATHSGYWLPYRFYPFEALR